MPLPLDGTIRTDTRERLGRRDRDAVQVEGTSVNPYAVIDPLERALNHAVATLVEALNHVGAKGLELVTGGRILVRAPRRGVDTPTTGHLQGRTGGGTLSRRITR